MGSIGPETTSSPTSYHLDQPLKGTPPPVIVFFSFLDKTSQQWATQAGVAQNIRRSMPAGTETHRYHVSGSDQSGWGFGNELTRAWAVATHLNVDDRVIGPLFETILVNKSVHDLEGIRELFWRVAGIDGLRFDRTWTDPKVIASMKYQDELSATLPREKLPCIVINGKEIIYGDEIRHMCQDEEFGPKVGQLVRELLDRH